MCLNGFSLIKIRLLKHIFTFFNRTCSHKSGTIWFNVANKSHQDVFQRYNDNSTLYIIYLKCFKDVCNISIYTLYIFISHICQTYIHLKIIQLLK